MNESNRVKETLKELAKLLKTVDLGEMLYEDASKYFEILSSKESSIKEKHDICVLVDNLISETRDFPKLNPINVRKKENQNVLM